MKLLWAAIACALMAACGNDSHRPMGTPTPSATNTATPTPTPTETPTPPNTYQLTDQSRFRHPDGSEEPATGRFDVFPCESFNTFYAYRIQSLAITSQSVTISLDVGGGELEAVTLPGIPDDQRVGLSAFVLINGASGFLTGSGPIDQPPTGETLTVDLSADSFALHLEARRTGPPFSFSPDLAQCS
jgi:hypothetical protein